MESGIVYGGATLSLHLPALQSEPVVEQLALLERRVAVLIDEFGHLQLYVLLQAVFAGLIDRQPLLQLDVLLPQPVQLALGYRCVAELRALLRLVDVSLVELVVLLLPQAAFVLQTFVVGLGDHAVHRHARGRMRTVYRSIQHRRGAKLVLHLLHLLLTYEDGLHDGDRLLKDDVLRRHLLIGTDHIRAMLVGVDSAAVYLLWGRHVVEMRRRRHVCVLHV